MLYWRRAATHTAPVAEEQAFLPRPLLVHALTALALLLGAIVGGLTAWRMALPADPIAIEAASPRRFPPNGFWLTQPG